MWPFMDTDTHAEGAQASSSSGGSSAEFLRLVVSAPARTPPEVAVGASWGTDGRYVVKSRLGRGGMGVVYVAHDSLLKRDVALKVLKSSLDPSAQAVQNRLLHEARVAACLEHDRIARVYDVGRHGGFLFVAMELVRGVTLRRWMHERRSSLEIEVVSLHIAEGLAALHERGVVHRDLKPENVMIAAHGGLKLLDFGLARQDGRHEALPAKSADEPLDSEGAVGGTPGYMAPEQYLGRAVDARVDVYAFGVVMYELISGVLPSWPGVQPRDGQAAALLFPTEAWQDVPVGEQNLIRRCLAANAEERFASGSELLEALKQVRQVGGSYHPVHIDRRALEEAPTVSSTPQTEPAQRRTRLASLGLLMMLGMSGDSGAWGAAHADPIVQAPAGMALVKGGTLTVGRTRAELDRECQDSPRCERVMLDRELPSARVQVAPFFLDVYEVSNSELSHTLNALAALLFVVEDEDDHSPRFVRWNKGLRQGDEILADLHPTSGGIAYTAEHRFVVRPGEEHRPAVQVSWYGAKVHCERLGKRLPTENEWEAAARGVENRRFPWGSAAPRCFGVVIPNDGMVRMPKQCPRTVLSARVGQGLQDVTVEGIRDLGGNVAEWVDGVFVAGNRNAPLAPNAELLARVVRGGSWGESFMARSSGRARMLPASAAQNVGFRCASSVTPGLTRAEKSTGT